MVWHVLTMWRIWGGVNDGWDSLTYFQMASFLWRNYRKFIQKNPGNWDSKYRIMSAIIAKPLRLQYRVVSILMAIQKQFEFTPNNSHSFIDFSIEHSTYSQWDLGATCFKTTPDLEKKKTHISCLNDSARQAVKRSDSRPMSSAYFKCLVSQHTEAWRCSTSPDLQGPQPNEGHLKQWLFLAIKNWY